MHLLCVGTFCFFWFNSFFHSFPISFDILTASAVAPANPLLVNPDAYNPAFPFQLLGNGVFGNPFSPKNSFSCSTQKSNSD